MHADETMIRFSEGTALWNPDSFDLPFSVVAHELAHQWWGHKLEAAFVEGAPVLSETLAVFSSMQVFNETFGRDQLHRLLAFMRKPFPYAPIRHGEPLLRAIDPYLAYRKGPFALHALGEHIGSGRVEDALQNLINNHPTGKLPLATTSDLYQELKAVTPDSLQTFLHDLFEVNTLWQFRVERAYTNETPNSTWDLTLEVKSTKIVVSETGVETEALLNDWVEIAVFDETGKPVYVRKHLITSELQTIKVNLDKKPSRAGIDPYHVLDWEEREDDENIRRVKTGY
jgi:aminopeptidase N